MSNFRCSCLSLSIQSFSSAGEGFGNGMTRTKAVITSDGLVSLNVPTIIESSCKIRVDNYPFDQQNCDLKFGSWTYDAAGIALTLEVNYPSKCYYVYLIDETLFLFDWKGRKRFCK